MIKREEMKGRGVDEQLVRFINSEIQCFCAFCSVALRPL